MKSGPRNKPKNMLGAYFSCSSWACQPQCKRVRNVFCRPRTQTPRVGTTASHCYHVSSTYLSKTGLFLASLLLTSGAKQMSTQSCSNGVAITPQTAFEKITLAQERV